MLGRVIVSIRPWPEFAKTAGVGGERIVDIGCKQPVHL